MSLDPNYLYLHNDSNNGPSTPGGPALEQMKLSPSVVQMTMDYLYVRNKLLDDGAVVQTEMGQDIVLSIVCDAYNHEAMKRRVQFVKVDNCDNG